MKLAALLVLLFLGTVVASYDVNMFYCGFNGTFCGQSVDDDVNPNAKVVILAFVNTQSDGSVIADEVNFPTNLTKSWQASGKKVVISVGGQNGNWPNVFASNKSTTSFVNALHGIVSNHSLDGVDLDIENYLAAPITVANMIKQLRITLGPDKLIIVSPEDVTVMQEYGIPPDDASTGYYNYFVPIINNADFAIDYYQVQAYNNWYEETAGSVQYLQNVYLNWRNLQGKLNWTKPFDPAIFKGVDGNKLLIGLEASPTAGGPNYYTQPDVITRFKDWLKTEDHPLKGFMMWDSHWDQLNGYLISTTCAA